MSAAVEQSSDNRIWRTGVFANGWNNKIHVVKISASLSGAQCQLLSVSRVSIFVALITQLNHTIETCAELSRCFPVRRLAGLRKRYFFHLIDAHPKFHEGENCGVHELVSNAFFLRAARNPDGYKLATMSVNRIKLKIILRLRDDPVDDKRRNRNRREIEIWKPLACQPNRPLKILREKTFRRFPSRTHVVTAYQRVNSKQTSVTPSKRDSAARLIKALRWPQLRRSWASRFSFFKLFVYYWAQEAKEEEEALLANSELLMFSPLNRISIFREFAIKVFFFLGQPSRLLWDCRAGPWSQPDRQSSFLFVWSLIG